MIISPIAAKAETAVSPDIVISQIYGGGGNAGSTYTNDFIELFNRGAAAVDVSTWSVQYASATGTSWSKTNLTGSIPPGKYLLVQEAVGAGGTTPLPAPDVTGTIAMSATAGKVALVSNQTALTGAITTGTGAGIVDFIGFGTTANGFEGTAPAPAPSNTLGDLRVGGGCTDTDSNNLDFAAIAPTPRNGSAPANNCGGSGTTNPSGTGSANPNTVPVGGTTLLTVAVTPGTNPTSTNLTATVNLTGIGGSATQSLFDNGTNGDATAGDNIFSYSATVAAATAPGGKTLPVTITDAQSRTGSASIALTVTSSSAPLSAVGAAAPASVLAGGMTLLTVTVTPGTNPASTGITVVADLTSIGGSATQAFLDNGTGGDQTAGDNIFSYSATVAAATASGTKTLTATASDAQGRTANATIMLTVTSPGVAQPLPFAQNWSNINLITVNNDWSGVPGIIGYRGDDLTTAVGADPQTILADGASTPVNVTANQTTPDTITSGGVYEFELANPVVAFQGSGTSDAPHIVISVNTTGANNVTVYYNLRDIDGSADNAVQPVALQYRIGSTGNYTNVPSAFVADATTGPNQATLVTPVAVRLPAAVDNQPLVQLRIITANATGSDEFVGIDDISVVSNGVIPLTARGGAAPNIITAGSSTLLTVAVNPATNPDSTNLVVTADLTSIGGSAAQVFYDDATHGDVTAGDNIFSFSAAIPANDPGSSRTFPVSVSDAQGHTATTSIALTVVAAADPQEHLVMGNPSNATMDVNNPFNYLLPKPQYVMSYHRDRAIPNWVSWHLDASWLGSADRQNDFRPDDALPAEWYHVTQFDYVGSGFDRGHNCPSGDRTRTVPDNSATFLMSNMMPQAPGNNQGPWEKLESDSRDLVGQGNELYVIAGSVGMGGTGSNGGITNTLADGKITVPSYTWKVILVLPVGDNDVSRVNENTRTIAVIMPNVDSIRPDAWQKYLATVDQVEALTGYDFFSNVPVAIQNVIESRLDAASNTSPQTVAAGTYTDLNIVSPNTALTGNITVNGNLNLGGSVLNSTSNFCVTLGPGATVTRLSGYVNGCVERQFTAASSFEYPVGTDNGYSPVTAAVTAVAQQPSSLRVKAVQSVQPNVSNPAQALKRYWTLTETGDLTANLTFKYLDADIPAGVNENNFRLQRYDGTFAEIPATLNTAANTVTANNISQFSDWTLIASATTAARTSFDFDGDGKSDLAVFRPSSGTWYLNQSTNGLATTQFGLNGDVIAPADYDGDGKTDLAVFRNNTWYLQRSTAGFIQLQFGASGDITMPADLDGDSKAELIVFRPSTGVWYSYNLATNQTNTVQFGLSGDRPVAADYDGDGKADLAVFRPSNATWYLQRSTLGAAQIQFGIGTDAAVPADYDGDGKTDIAVFRNGTWYLQQSTAGFAQVQFGLGGDLPAPADYDGDGKTDLAVFRNGTWYLQRTTAGFTGISFGLAGDLPAQNAFVR